VVVEGVVIILDLQDQVDQELVGLDQYLEMVQMLLL
jgi:hypothetical protein